MPNKILDNSSDIYQLKTTIKEFLCSVKYSHVAIATRYWDLPGMVDIINELSSFLSREKVSFRLLLGEEPTVRAYLVKKPQQIDPDFPEMFLKRDLEDLQLKEEYQQVAYCFWSILKKMKPDFQNFKLRFIKKNFFTQNVTSSDRKKKMRSV